MNSLEKIQSKLVSFEDAPNFRKNISSKIVFTNGCFDILHRGHVNYLAQAKALGGFLWVGINSDDSVRKLKGPSRPVNSELDRAFVLSALESVDAVTLFHHDTPVELLLQIRPEIHTKGGDYIKEKLIEFETVCSFGGEVIILPFVDGQSTTSIIKRASGR